MNKSYLFTGTLFVILSASGIGYAQNRVRDQKAINYVRQSLVSKMESGMPRERFDTWFRRIAGKGHKVRYGVNDCGEQTGTPADRGRDFPMCVEAKAEAEVSAIEVTIQVGTFKKGITGRPTVRGIGIEEEGEERIDIKELSDLTWTLGKLRGKIVK